MAIQNYQWKTPSGKWEILCRSAKGESDRHLDWIEWWVKDNTTNKTHTINCEIIYPGVELLTGGKQKEMEFNMIYPRGRRGGEIEVPMNVRSQLVQMSMAMQKEWLARVEEPISREITYFGRKTIATCDAWCEKAFGWNSRPKVQLDPNNDDDVVYLPDNEVGNAPVDPGTYEGGYAKPTTPAQRMNKWCIRECERCVLTEPGEEVKMLDWFKPVFNIPREERQLDAGNNGAASAPTGV